MADQSNSSSIYTEPDANRLYKIIDSTPLGICITSADGRFDYVNPTYCRLYGYSREELLGNHFSMVVPEEFREQLNQLHDSFMLRESELRGEWTVRRKDGSLMSILADAAYVEDVDGPKKVTFIIDISERKTMELELERTVERLNREIEERSQLERTKDEVEKMVRHDLRNPLNAMLIATQLLLSDELTDKQKDLVNMIQDSGQKLHYMISSSIDLIRMEEGKYVLSPRCIRITDLVRIVMQETTPAREAHAVRVELLYNSEPMMGSLDLCLEGEKIHLENLFSNLLRNAAEASPEGATVIWEVNESGDNYLFRIHNDGVIPEDVRCSFFQRFSTSGKRNGTGLGTHIAKLITEAHRGRIWFESSESSGTSLFVELPKSQSGFEDFLQQG